MMKGFKGGGEYNFSIMHLVLVISSIAASSLLFGLG